jgi:hypothetical protein
MSGECDKCHEHALDCDCEDIETQEWLNAPMGRPIALKKENEYESLINALKYISRIIDNVTYELEGRVYTLDENAMANIFSCRDLADETLRNLKKPTES